MRREVKQHYGDGLLHSNCDLIWSKTSLGFKEHVDALFTFTSLSDPGDLELLRRSACSLFAEILDCGSISAVDNWPFGTRLRSLNLSSFHKGKANQLYSA